MSKRHFVVNPSVLEGELKPPPSKSQTLRALVFALLAQGVSRIKNPLLSPDVYALIEGCRSLGGKVFLLENENEIEVEGRGLFPADNVIDVGNSGIGLRFLGAISALASGRSVFTGDRSIRENRVLAPLLEGLNQLGAEAFSLRGNQRAPFLVKGPLQGGHAVIDGADSQPVSGLLIASAFAKGPTDLFVLNPGERPFVKMTLEWFDRLGIKYRAKDFSHFAVEGSSEIKGFNYTVQADFSSLAFPLVAAVITGSSLRISKLDFSDPQGDKKIIEYLQQMNASLSVQKNGDIELSGSHALQGCRLNINDCIDTLPILAVLGCFAKGKTTLLGAGMARKKECNRIQAMVAELKKMGASISELDDGIEVYHSELHGATLSSHLDHRVAMALTVAACAAEGESVIEDVMCIAKTYPHFHTQLHKLGASITCH